MTKRYVTPLLVSLSVVVWLAASLYLTEVSVQYDDAVLSNSYYFWFYAPAALIAGCLNSGKAAPRKPSRAGDVLIFFVFTGLAFLLFYQPGGMRRLPYLLYVWWLALLLLLLLLAALYRHIPCRHPQKKQRTQTPLHGVAIVVLLLYLSIALVTALYLAVLHPVSVEQITPIGEAEGALYRPHHRRPVTESARRLLFRGRRPLVLLRRFDRRACQLRLPCTSSSIKVI
ncbi:hypothetical protein RX717_07260 [Intestinibacillus sp. NTUH-41-i26]|uniref:hypothetical protein n=1 Tax=Intestinibacillus sp. NTUH-41-i26 TaxID=3079303 RepID=UPI0029345D90|nr:hypothetical protein [Intestinibacillus sp. NTUH-41-i26]WOC76756.1 hypothetical protein RX717_07260 [Intestinibacillus sp. NTUH-41-i26]